MISLRSYKGQPYRLNSGGRIDRINPVNFTFNDRKCQGYQGDTLASALLANGVHLVGRSFKYHRPRGIMGSGPEEPNALLQIGKGAYTIPNLKATEVELYEGLQATSVNCWPSVKYDIASVNDYLARVLPAGFYYKTFMWPRRFWKLYEHFIRLAAGLGVSPKEPDPNYYDKMNTHCDVLVIGGGPAGLAAALEAGKSGARVILADEQRELGGSLLSSVHQIDGAPGTEWVKKVIEELKLMKEVRLFTRSTVSGYYDHNFLAMVHRRTDHLPPGQRTGPRERLWRVRAKQVVIATGAIERPLIFPNNDRPGVMLASAVSQYIHRYGVLPGREAVLFTNNDSAYQTALDLSDAGGLVAAVIDLRPNPHGTLTSRVRKRGIDVITGHAVIDVLGKKRVKSVKIMQLDVDASKVTGPSGTINCDLLGVSGGWNPNLNLYGQSGGKPVFDKDKGCFVPGVSVQAERSAGACRGTFGLSGCLAEGLEAGRTAAQAAGFGDGVSPAALPNVSDAEEEPQKTVWLVPSPHPVSREHKQFVDFQEDVSAGDIALAAREGYDRMGLMARYTTLGFGTDQGKLGNTLGAGILAQLTGKDIQKVGIPTHRPAYTPVTIGVLAGPDIKDLLDPVRKTAIHPWHEAHGAVFENVGQWKRPHYYPKPGEGMHQAVNRECLAARNQAGLLDQSTLGKIDIQGPDALRLLNMVYTNGWTNLQIGRARYGLMLGEDGMVLDDGVTARLGENHYIMYTTTGGAAPVMAWLERWLQTEWPDWQVYLTSVTDHYATMSVVGPYARRIMRKLCQDIDFSQEAFPFMSSQEGTVAGVPARVFRVSFTGELSYEINVNANYGLHVWEGVMKAGQEYGLTPFGTEGMHILRAEKGFIIVGQDTDGTVTPIDLGMDWIVSKRKEFIGKRSLLRQDTSRPDRKHLVGLLTEDPSFVLPEGSQIVDDPSQSTPLKMLGHVTSSYYSANLGRSIALAMLKSGRDRMGQRVYLSMENGRAVTAIVAGSVFYDPEGERQKIDP